MQKGSSDHWSIIWEEGAAYCKWVLSVNKYDVGCCKETDATSTAHSDILMTYSLVHNKCLCMLAMTSINGAPSVLRLRNHSCTCSAENIIDLHCPKPVFVLFLSYFRYCMSLQHLVYECSIEHASSETLYLAVLGRTKFSIQ